MSSFLRSALTGRVAVWDAQPYWSPLFVGWNFQRGGINQSNSTLRQVSSASTSRSACFAQRRLGFSFISRLLCSFPVSLQALAGVRCDRCHNSVLPGLKAINRDVCHSVLGSNEPRLISKRSREMKENSKRQHDCERCGKELQYFVSHLSTRRGFNGSLYHCEMCGLATTRDDQDDALVALGLAAWRRLCVMNVKVLIFR